MEDHLEDSDRCPDPSRRSFVSFGAATAAMFFTSRRSISKGSGEQARDVDLAGLTLSEAADLVREKKVSPPELTHACLRRIDQLNPLFNAFITVNAEESLLQSREAQAEISRGRYRGVLHGIPIALKDNIDTAGTRTTAGSSVFLNRVPSADAEVVRRLKAAGAVILGKANLDEFAFGHTSTLSHFGPVRNPWKRDCVAGGSSGGCAAAVAARLCYGALGTDTSCSIRLPAAYCGIVGLRPSHGLVSTRGCVPLAPSLDVIGPMCRTVTDAAHMLSVISGYDGEDVHSVRAPAVDYAAVLGGKVRRPRVGIARDLITKIEHRDVRAAMDGAIAVLRSLAERVRDLELPAVPSETIANILLPEAYAFHAPLLAKSADLYQPTIRQRAEFGSSISAASYISARNDLARLQRTIARVFVDVDVIVAPTSYTTAPTIEQTAKEEVGPPPALPTVDFSIYGLPTVSIPCGFSISGLPIGLQIAGRRLGEATVLSTALAFERATKWHTRTHAM